MHSYNMLTYLLVYFANCCSLPKYSCIVGKLNPYLQQNRIIFIIIISLTVIVSLKNIQLMLMVKNHD